MFRMSGFPAALQLLHKHPNPYLPLPCTSKTNLMAAPYNYKPAFITARTASKAALRIERGENLPSHIGLLRLLASGEAAAESS